MKNSMKYFIDTEFIEGFYKPVFGKNRHFIDLISIGIASEDGRKLYLLSSEYDYDKADEWVKKNVILPIYLSMVHGDLRNRWDASNFHKTLGISNKEIAHEVAAFCNCYQEQLYWRTNDDVEFYAYYADYDWVVFCSLFGRMIDLPKGFPMYCKDLKQTLDERAQKIADHPNVKSNLKEGLKLIKNRGDFPKQGNEHNALDDAMWNKNLYEFLQTPLQ